MSVNNDVRYQASFIQTTSPIENIATSLIPYIQHVKKRCDRWRPWKSKIDNNRALDRRFRCTLNHRDTDSVYQISLLLAKLIGPQNNVKSVTRTKSHEANIKAASAHPLLLCFEDSPMSEFTQAFEGVDVVYFSAGAGGKGGPDATKKVDYEGALKVFDVIEGIAGKTRKPRLVLVSAVNVRNPDGPVPSHYVITLAKLRRCSID